MSGVNPRELIQEIKIRPGIYNREALEPPRREHKHMLWLEVAERLTPADVWESYTDIEKDARIDEIAAKWKHVKTNFHRDVKLEEAGQSHKKRKYIYFNELEFMRPFIGVRLPPVKRGRNSIDSLEDTDDLVGNDTDIDMESFLKSTDEADEDTSKTTADSSSVIQSRTKSKRLIKPTLKAMENKASSSTSNPLASRTQKETVIKNLDVIKKTGGDTANASFKIRDGDISFCLSLVPTLRKLGDGRKIRAKIEILKVLHRYVDHIERRNLVANHRNTVVISQNADIEDDMAEDHLEEYEEGVIIKNEENDDPLNGNNGNTKTWWT